MGEAPPLVPCLPGGPLRGGLGTPPKELPQECLCSLLPQFTAWGLSVIKTLKASSKSSQAASEAPSGRSLMRSVL